MKQLTPTLILLDHLFFLQDENLTIRLVIAADKEPLTLIIPTHTRQSPARALRQRRRNAVPGALRG